MQKRTLQIIQIQNIIYILQTGLAWRQYRGIFNFNTLYWHFNRFVNHEIFKIKLYSPIIQYIDTSFVPNKCGRDKLSYNKFYNNKRGNKISCVTDSLGVPLSIFFNKDSTYDLSFIELHLKDTVKILKK